MQIPFCECLDLPVKVSCLVYARAAEEGTPISCDQIFLDSLLPLSYIGPIRTQVLVTFLSLKERTSEGEGEKFFTPFRIRGISNIFALDGCAKKSDEGGKVGEKTWPKVKKSSLVCLFSYLVSVRVRWRRSQRSGGKFNSGPPIKAGQRGTAGPDGSG